MTESGYSRFISQLDLFLRRYYTNRAFKGGVAFLALLVLGALGLGLAQFFGFFGKEVRAALFFGVLAVLSVFLIIFVVWPLLQASGRVGRMSRMQAARYLSERFPEAGDRLYNVLELGRLREERENASTSSRDTALLEAAIEQISGCFVSYRFERVVRLRGVLPYVYVFAGLCLLWMIVAAVEPRVAESAAQVVRYNVDFEPVFPFKICCSNPVLRVGYEEDFTLEVNVEGEKLPEKIFLVQGDRVQAMSRRDANTFSFVFKKVRQAQFFRLRAGKFVSPEYELSVERKPLMSGMRAVLRYPSYTGRATEVVSNTLDLTVPYGTEVEWEMKWDYTRLLRVWSVEAPSGSNRPETAPAQPTSVHTSAQPNAPAGPSPLNPSVRPFAVDSSARPLFRFKTNALADFTYCLAPKPFADVSSDTLSFAVAVVPDAYPHIRTAVHSDSLYPLKKYYTGFISDDYGFHTLVFTARCANASHGLRWERFDTLRIEAREREQTFTYFIDLACFALEPGDELSYGFSLSDNDPFYPYKTVYTPLESYRKMSVEEVREELERTSNSIDNNFSLSLRQNVGFKEDLEKMVEDLLSKRQFSWQDLQKVELLMEKQRELRARYEALNEELEHKRELEGEMGLESSELLEKQKELQELLRELLDDKTMEKLSELQSLMEKQASQDKVMDKLEELRFDEERMAKDLEQNMSLYRQMEFELRMDALRREMQNLLQKGDELADKLAELTPKQLEEKDGRLKDSLKAENERLATDLEKLGTSFKEWKELDSKLDKPNGVKIPDSLMKTLERDIQKTSESLDGGKAGESRENHGRTMEDMQRMADELNEQFDALEEENMAEDADYIRLLLRSILRVSLEQEDLMVRLENTHVSDPAYADFIRRQGALNLEVGFVVDSVRAIARRQPKVAIGTRQILSDLERNSRESLEYLLGMNDVHYRRYSTTNSWALTRQRFTMTSLNDLALMLSLSLDNMQEKMSSKGGGSSSKKKKRKGQPQMSCPNPGEKPSQGQQQPKFPSLGQQGKSGKEGRDKTLQQMQKALNEQIDALKKLLEEKAAQEAAMRQGGSKSSSGKTGEGGEKITDEQVSEAFARAAAQQERIRRMLQEKMAREKDNAANGLYNSVLGDMERTEKDLSYKALTSTLLERQKRIETRMLEAENAELTREKDDRRESRQGQVFAPPAIDSLELKGREAEATRELLLRQTPALRPFYRKKVQEYMFTK